MSLIGTYYKGIVNMNEHTFNKMMEEIDSELKLENIEIYSRSLKATIKIAKRLEIKEMPLIGHAAIPGVYTADSLSAHVENWFIKRYGTKMKKDFRLCKIILILKGEAFLVGMPMIYGQIKIICDPSLKKYEIADKNEQIPIFNLLTHIEDLTPDFASTLTDSEMIDLVKFYGSTYNAIIDYYDYGLPFQQEALTDLENAVDSFFYNHQHFGQSKWSSLQFTEKLLKGVIENTGNSFPKSHKLKDLSKIVKEVAGIKICEETLSSIDCKPDVRYSAELVSDNEAVKAHHASLEVLRTIMNSICNDK